MIKNNIKEDLNERKNTIHKVSAYSSLRKAVNFLALVFKIGIIISALTGLIIYGQLLNHSAIIIVPMFFIVFSAFLSWLLVQVIAQFVSAIIDGIDLQLLSNRRNEIDRTAHKENT